MSERVVWVAHGAPAPAFTLALAGDVLPADLGTMSKDAWRARAERTAPLLDGADRLVANLECPLGVEALPAQAKGGLGSTLAGPSAAVAYLTALRTAVAGLANNHAYDFGPHGVARTVELVEAAGVIALGAGRTLADPPLVHLVGDGPVRVSVWIAAGRSLELATASRAGCEVATRERAAQALAAGRKAGATAHVALLHLGIERTNRPDPDDVRLMDDVARLSFDVVAACHSHRTSGYALIPRDGAAPAICLYGLGSLLSTVVYGPPEREGVVALLGLHADGRPVRLALRAVRLGDDGVGEPPPADVASAILDRVDEIAAEIADGTYVRAFHADIAHGLGGRQWRDAVAAFHADGVRGLIAKARRLRMRHVKGLVHAVLRLRGRHRQPR